jgi:cell division septal protein FtsQ
MARVVLPESRLRARRKRRRARLAIVAGGFFALLLIILVGVSHLPFLQVREVLVAGATTVATSSVEEYVHEQIAGMYVFVFPKRNIFLYPQSAIAAGLLQKFPELRAVDVRAENFHTIAAEVVEREPKSRWCTDDVCYLMDQSGVIYASALGADAYVAYRGKTVGDLLPKQYLEPEMFEALSALVDALSQKPEAGRIVEVLVDNNNDAVATFESGFRLKFALGDAAGDVFERFTLALTAEPFVANTPADFEYLDLRFGDKLYYKLK